MGVILVTFHPRTSHKLLPLGRTVYGPFNTAMNEHMLIPGNVGKPGAIHEVFTPSNITQGFKVTEHCSLNENIFQDHEFAPSNVTDRPLPSKPKEPHLASSPNRDTTMTLSECSTSKSVITPSTVTPFPQTVPRKESRKGEKRVDHVFLRAFQRSCK